MLGINSQEFESWTCTLTSPNLHNGNVSIEKKKGDGLIQNICHFCQSFCFVEGAKPSAAIVRVECGNCRQERRGSAARALCLASWKMRTGHLQHNSDWTSATCTKTGCSESTAWN